MQLDFILIISVILTLSEKPQKSQASNKLSLVIVIILGIPSHSGQHKWFLL